MLFMQGYIEADFARRTESAFVSQFLQIGADTFRIRADVASADTRNGPDVQRRSSVVWREPNDDVVFEPEPQGLVRGLDPPGGWIGRGDLPV